MSYAIWLYHRSSLSFRDIEDPLYGTYCRIERTKQVNMLTIAPRTRTSIHAVGSDKCKGLNPSVKHNDFSDYIVAPVTCFDMAPT